MSKTTFNFGNAEAAAELEFLKPGVYAMKISEVKLGVFPQKKTGYLGITFTNEDGQSYTEKLSYASEKAVEVFMSRLQYLHEAWTNKKLDKVFKSIEEVESYFGKAFVNPKAGTRNVIIGGETNGKVTYASLPFTNFIVPKDSDLELGEFEEGDANWKKYVKVSDRKSEASGKKNGILNDTSDNKEAATDADDSNDTPW
jgi:hypothetical protein